MSTAVADDMALHAVVSSDRLGIILGISLVAHALVILSVSFTLTQIKNDSLPSTLEVKLVQQKTDENPQDARYIANEANAGGGTEKEPASRFNPFLAPYQSERVDIAFRPGSTATQEALPDAMQLITSDQARRNSLADDPDQEKKRLKNNHNAIDAVSLKLATLRDAVDRGWNNLAQRPKKNFVHTRTKQHPAATYMLAVIAKVERYGNQHYPPDQIKGEVILSMEILRNGTVQDIKIEKSAPAPGYNEVVLIDAAKSIVHHASPFAPMAQNITDTDILVITRTFKFNGATFSSSEKR